MLYKKIHRQFLREFKKDREFRIKFTNKQDIIIEKPHIFGRYIWIAGYVYDCKLVSLANGQFLWKDVVWKDAIQENS